MEGKIDEAGVLLIKRNGEFKKQICIYDESECNCADWCPQFGEPELAGNILPKKDGSYHAEQARIKICINKNIEFEGFTDERK